MRFKTSGIVNLHEMTYICLNYCKENSKLSYMCCCFSLQIFYLCCCLHKELPIHWSVFIGNYEKTEGILNKRKHDDNKKRNPATVTSGSSQ